MGGKDCGKAGAGGGVAATLAGVAPDRDGAIGFEGGKGRAGSRNAYKLAATGERIITGGSRAPGGDAAIGADRREGVGVGIDCGVTVVGGQGGQQAAKGGVAPGSDRPIRLQRRESAGIRGDGDIAGAGWRAAAAAAGGTPRDQTAIGFHGHHGLAVGEDLGEAGAGGFAGAAR